MSTFNALFVTMVMWVSMAQSHLFHRGEDGSKTWVPAAQTAGLKPDGDDPMVPEPTSPPKMRFDLAKRQAGADTCGYITGDPLESVTCGGGQVCKYNSYAGAVGCCYTTASCSIWTACLGYYSSSAASSADLERTKYCSNSAYPYCAVLSYADPVWAGYTLPYCDSTRTTILFYKSTFGPDTTTPFQTTPRTPISPSTTPFTSPSSSTGSAAPINTSDLPPPVPAPSSESSTPIGAIVGGVVGGIGAIALIGLGIFFLMRRKRSHAAEPAAAPPVQQIAPFPGASPSSPAPTYDFYGAGKPPMSPAVSHYDPSATMSPTISLPPGSPPPPSFVPSHPTPQSGFASPPQSYMAPQSPPPQQPYPQQTYPQYNTNPQTAELPTTKPDGQLHEVHG
ncbi:hypothetical protein B0H63DRAFT_470876 [Podospora didyma]|uniref:Mid2 domain-containing protein n=1 Tax=Podospora didyma TaxID=330526 RepID=A0AAE0NU39_9PEZI|nr:hypothetical protein B0H63DRAFT_470876 [Podospora didyma]